MNVLEVLHLANYVKNPSFGFLGNVMGLIEHAGKQCRETLRRAAPLRASSDSAARQLYDELFA